MKICVQLTYRYDQSQREVLKNAYNNDSFGNYLELDTANSKSTRNYSTEQRASLAFRSVRPKFNYTVGFNLDPTYTRTESFVGDYTTNTISRNVLNFSPTLQLNYLYNRQTNLRIDYDGRISQPTMQQLQPVPDLSDPQNSYFIVHFIYRFSIFKGGGSASNMRREGPPGGFDGPRPDGPVRMGPGGAPPANIRIPGFGG